MCLSQACSCECSLILPTKLSATGLCFCSLLHPLSFLRATSSYCSVFHSTCITKYVYGVHQILRSSDESSYWLRELRVYLNANMLLNKYAAILTKTVSPVSSTDCSKFVYNSSFIKLYHKMSRDQKHYNPA